jgi:tRNA threonylcarbamoyladenosine biosynthesis protein TsaB
MRIALRTDTVTAELLLLKPDGTEVARERWEAGRQLSSQLLDRIQSLLVQYKFDWEALTGVIVFRGPGSFTGLRIGVAVANAIAYAQAIPIVGTGGDGWVADGAERLQAGETDTQVKPEYGAAPHITRPPKAA